VSPTITKYGWRDNQSKPGSGIRKYANANNIGAHANMANIILGNKENKELSDLDKEFGGNLNINLNSTKNKFHPQNQKTNPSVSNHQLRDKERSSEKDKDL